MAFSDARPFRSMLPLLVVASFAAIVKAAVSLGVPHTGRYLSSPLASYTRALSLSCPPQRLCSLCWAAFMPLSCPPCRCPRSKRTCRCRWCTSQSPSSGSPWSLYVCGARPTESRLGAKGRLARYGACAAVDIVSSRFSPERSTLAHPSTPTPLHFSIQGFCVGLGFGVVFTLCWRRQMSIDKYGANFGELTVAGTACPA